MAGALHRILVPRPRREGSHMDNGEAYADLLKQLDRTWGSFDTVAMIPVLEMIDDILSMKTLGVRVWGEGDVFEEAGSQRYAAMKEFHRL